MSKRWAAIWLCVILLLTMAASHAAAEQTDAAFEQHLTDEKFPESYKPALRALHAQYPSWVFTAQHVGIDWAEALAAECKVGTSLVPASSLASWKSCEKGAYDPAAGVWYGLDGSNWVAASREIIAYYLDPRNALNDTAIFQFENLAYSEHQTIAGVQNILNGSFMSGSYQNPDDGKTYTYADTFMEVGKLSGVSPYHLASRARQEQGSKGSPLGHGTVAGYEGYYNFFNINAYATSNATALQNGAKYAAGTNPTYYLPWTSPYKSLLGGAAFLGAGYINRGQNTLYLQKFDMVDGGNGYFSHQYMTNILAPTSEASIMKKAYTDEVLASAMEFCIPVYDNMPEQAAVKPTSSGDNNNWLTALSVSGQTLTPTFSMYTTSYELVVGSGVSSVTVTAKTSGAAATVGGTGVIPLKSGDNTLPVTVTAASGSQRVYTLRIYRTPAEGGDPAPTLTSTVYRVGDSIGGVKPETAVKTLLAGLQVSDGGTTAVCTADGKTMSADATVGTGCVVQVLQSGVLCAAYPVVIKGDVSGDGRLDSLDLLKIQKHILGVSALSDVARSAADVSGDGIIDSLDLLKLQKHLLGLTTLTF